jgi:signal peptidase I
MHLTVRRAVGLVLAGVVALIAAAFATGLFGYVVTHGVSMEPLYHTGDLVVIARADSYHIGEIVAYHGGTDGNLVTLHRIVGGNANGFLIKGDNNQSVDPTHPRASQIIGRAVLHIPGIGGVIGSPITHIAVLLAVLALIAAFIKNPAPRPGAAHGSRRATDRSTTAWKLLLALDLVFLVALGLSFGLGSTASAPAYTQTGVLSYQARVPASATYPTGQVSTGDPVFMKLLTDLGVSFYYSTTAPPAAVHGTVQIDAVLSNAAGWHTTLPMATPTPLKAGGANLTSTLDLSYIQVLATRVASQTGLGTGPIDIAVTASAVVGVGSAKPVTYTSRLPLQLTTLELSMSGTKVSSSAHGAGVVSTTSLSPTAPGAHPSSPTYGDLRLGLLALLLLAIAATALVWPASSDEDARAVTRVPSLAIELASTTNQVQVADHAALEQIARRLGAPIIQGPDGWEGVFGPESLYHATTPQPVPATPTEVKPISNGHVATPPDRVLSRNP